MSMPDQQGEESGCQHTHEGAGDRLGHCTVQSPSLPAPLAFSTVHSSLHVAPLLGIPQNCVPPSWCSANLQARHSLIAPCPCSGNIQQVFKKW